jgi:hypothetical protein
MRIPKKLSGMPSLRVRYGGAVVDDAQYVARRPQGTPFTSGDAGRQAGEAMDGANCVHSAVVPPLNRPQRSERSP